MTWLGSRLTRASANWRLAGPHEAVAALLDAPSAVASPESDAANAAIDRRGRPPAATVARRRTDGDVYPVRRRFAQKLHRRKIFFTPATGAHLLFGAILDKYQALAAAADGDLVPDHDEVAGLLARTAGSACFSASDKPAIFWTAETGAWVVSGGPSTPRGTSWAVPGARWRADRRRNLRRDVVSQKFTGGTVSYNNATKVFTTDPPDLAANLAGVEVPSGSERVDQPGLAGTGGTLVGVLGARQAPQYTVAATVPRSTTPAARSSTRRDRSPRGDRVRSWRSTNRPLDRPVTSACRPAPRLTAGRPTAGSARSAPRTSR